MAYFPPRRPTDRNGITPRKSPCPERADKTYY